ncbi:MAG: hypothetical protein Q9226_008934, partial [Calogaya cf. arnoldii]
PGVMGDSIGILRLMMKSLSKTRPWMLDSAVINLPWRSDSQLHSSHSRATKQLSLGIMRTDGVVAPYPPITRALHMVIQAVEAAGYESTILDADGRADVFQQLSLSGEPLIPELVPEFGHEPLPPMPLLEFCDQVLQLKAFRNEYAAYWASTAEKTKSGILSSSFQTESTVGQVELTVVTGRSVDAVILPAAPTAAILPGKWYHHGYSTIANTLDYATVVIPVTFADKKLDSLDDTYQPLNEKDEKNWLACRRLNFDKLLVVCG